MLFFYFCFKMSLQKLTIHGIQFNDLEMSCLSLDGWMDPSNRAWDINFCNMNVI